MMTSKPVPTPSAITRLKRTASRAVRTVPVLENAWRRYRRSRRPQAPAPVKKAAAKPTTFGPVITELTHVRWVGEATLELRGSVYSQGVQATPTSRPRLEILLRDDSGAIITATVEQVVDAEINNPAADAKKDYKGAAFVAELDLVAVADAAPGHVWQLRYKLRKAATILTGPFGARSTLGSAGLLQPSGNGAEGCLLPKWTDKEGLTLVRSAKSIMPTPRSGAGVAVSAFVFEEGESPQVKLEGEVFGLETGLDGESLRLEMTGPQGTIAAQTDRMGERFTGTFPLLVEAWGGPLLPLTVGHYDISATWHTPGGVQSLPVQVSGVGAQSLPDVLRSDRLYVRLVRTGANLPRVQIRAPRHDDEIGRFGQTRLEQAYQTTEVVPDGSIYFETFHGRSAADSPRAIHDELVRRGTTRPLYWAVGDFSVPVPDGATPVMIRSREWWELLAKASHFIFNQGSPGPLRKRDDQVMVQAWHGTPLKLLGMDRPVNNQQPNFAERQARSTARWDFMIAGNTYSAEIFKYAYCFQGPMLDLGYPRNDALVDVTDDDRARIRRNLGIASDQKIVLYAPTWRDGDKTIVGYLDLEDLSRKLGPSYTILLRGHGYTLMYAQRRAGSQLIDVTNYPLINELFWIADVTITDYSSIMFDFTVTGKPIMFFTPDLDDYRDRRRGMYFDLPATAPGPVLRTPEEVVEALQRIDQIQHDYTEKYAAWRAKFNPRDDGQASRRVVDAIFGPGQS